MTKLNNKCSLCGKTTNNNKFCSRDCANKSNIKIKLDLPSKPTDKFLSSLTYQQIHNSIDKALSDLKASVGGPYSTDPNEIIKEKQRSLPKTISYGAKNFGNRFQSWNKPFHDLGEVARAIDSITEDRPVIVRIDGKITVDAIGNLFEAIKGNKIIDGNREYLYPDNNVILEALTYDKTNQLDYKNLPDWFIDKYLTSMESQSYREHKAKKYSSNVLTARRGPSLARIRKKVIKHNQLLIKGCWKRIPYIYRHKVNKDLYTVRTKFGETTVTEDHGLISFDNGNFTEVKPTDKSYIPVSISEIPVEFITKEIDLSIYFDKSKYLKTNEDSIVNWCGKDKRLLPFSFVYKFDIDDSRAMSWARLLGGYISEGSVSDNVFRIASSNRSWIEALQKDFYNVFNRKSTIVDEPTGMHHLECVNRLICSIFKNAAGFKSSGKKIPNEVYSWPLININILLNKAIEGDGHINEDNRKCYTTKSKLLASGVQLLFKFIGLNVSLSFTHRNNTTYYDIREVPFNSQRAQIYRHEIEKIDRAKFNWVYDLEVEDTHMFVDGVGCLLLHNTESYLARSVQKHREYALKEGWFLHGLNPETVTYIKNRLMEMEFISDCLTEEWIADSFTNLISYHNFFLVLSRDPTRTTGRMIRMHGKDIEPISAIFPMDPTTVDVKQNLSGRPIRWRQKVDSKEVTFDPADVIHGHMDKKTGFIFGTPYVIPVLDDIRSLRRLEELSELVAHKHLFPLFHYQVGTEESPAETLEMADGTMLDEVQMAKDAVNNLPSEGGLVTSERHKITLIGSEDKVLDLTNYIEHFEARVMGGLRLSGIDVGRGDTSNRATAGVINKNLMEAVKDYQRVFTSIISKKLLAPLLLEAGYDLNEENMVWFRFPPIDREELRAQQTHGMLMFTNNVIDQDEFRIQYLSVEPMTDEQKSKTNYSLFVKPLADIKAAPKPGSGDSGGKAVTTVAIPENQHGKAVKPTTPKNDLISSIEETWNSVKYYLSSNGQIDNYDSAFSQIKVLIRSQLIDSCISYASNSYNDFCKDNDKLSFKKEIIEIKQGKLLDNDLQEIIDKVIIHLRQKTCDKSIVIETYKPHLISYIKRHIDTAMKIGKLEFMGNEYNVYDAILH